MALLQRTRILPQQRLDLPDFRNIEDFVCADFKAQFKNIWTGENFVLKGFVTTGIGTNAISMALAGSALIVGSDDGTMFIGAPSLSPATSDALTPASTNYVELSIEQDTGGADSRAFWDPTAAAGQGGEFSQIVDTFIFTKAKLNINTSNFTGAADRVPICEVDVNGSGIITDIRDARNMFWRLGRRGQDTFQYSWASRTEPPVSQFNGADKDIDSEKAWKDAVMSRILELDGGLHWFEDSGVSNVGAFRNVGLSMTTSQSTDAKWSWDGSLLKLTDSNVTPLDADAVAAIRLFDSTSNLMLTRQDGTGGSTAFALADGDVLWVELPDPLANVNYSGIGLTASNFRVSPRGSVPNNDTTFWLAFRDGANVYLRFFGELQPGEDVEISDNVNENILAAIGIAEETDMPNYTSNNIVVDGTSLVAAISALDAAAGIAGIQANQDRSLKLIEGGTWHVNLAGDTLSWSADAFIDVPEVTRVSNRILSGNIVLPNANSVAYVEINRASGPATLTVLVADIDALTPTENTVIIARRVTDGILVGRTCFLLKPDEYLELDGALAEINRKLGQLKLRPHETSPFKARIDAADITQLDDSVLSQIIGDFLLKFDGAVINFQTGVINEADDTTPLGVNFTPFSIPANQYFWYGVSLIPGNVLSDNTQEAQVQVDLASAANATQANAPKPVISGDIKLGAIQIFNNAGSLEISETRKLGVGSGSGSGSGDASAVDTALRDRFSLNNFLFLTENIFRTDKDTKYDLSSTGAYAPAKKAFGFANAGETLVSSNHLDADFLADGIDISEVEFYLFWLAGFIDTTATYEVSRDGGTNWQLADMERIGLTNAYRVHHTFTDEVTPQTLQSVAATGAGTALNATTAQQLSSQLVLANTSVIKTLQLSMNKAAAAVGNMFAQIVADNAGVPSTDPADILAESSAVNITSLSTGNITVNVDMPDTTLVAGTYHIVLRTDAAYKAGTMDLSWRSGAGTNGAAYNGTVWTGAASTKAAVVEGRALDLRVRVTSSAGLVYIEGYGVYYDSSIGIQPSSTRKIAKFIFSGDENRTDFACNFQLDPYIVSVYDPLRGQVYVPDTAGDSALRVDGNTLKFAANTFNFPGEQIVLIVRQLEGNGVDVSQDNAAKIFANQQNLVDLGDLTANQVLDHTLLPQIATPFTTIVNRSYMPDLSQNLSAHFGVSRIMCQQIFEIPTELGPNGEQVFGVVGDRMNQVRFIGNFAQQNSIHGVSPFSSQQSSAVEISFYGTGLNILGFPLSGSSDIVQFSVDGGALTGNIYPTGTVASVLPSRNYATNVITPVIAGLALAHHTVRLVLTTNTGNAPFWYGFEILAESSTGLIRLNPGTEIFKGVRRSITTQQSYAYNTSFESGVLGTRGGRVLVYQKSDGTIAKAVTPTDASQLNGTSANHSNEEMYRSHYFREFTASRSDDPGSITNATTTRSFTLDDNETQLSLSNAFNNLNLSNIEGISFQASGDQAAFTFVGTGLDIKALIQISATSPDIAIVVDGVATVTLTAANFPQGNVPQNVKIVSGLPYGSHTVRFVRGAGAGTNIIIQEFRKYRPKTPTLPAGASAKHAYNILADFSAAGVAGNTLADNSDMYQGVIAKSVTREVAYFGTGWSLPALSTGSSVFLPGGYWAGTTTNNDFMEYTFYGTGIALHAIDSAGGTSIFSVTIDGVANATGANLLSITNNGGGSYTVNTTTGFLPARVVFSGLTLGKHTIRFTKTGGSGGNFAPTGLYVITPVHSQRAMDLAYQNSNSVGNSALEDLRQFSVTDVPKNKVVGHALNITGSAQLTSSTVPVPMPDMGVLVKSKGGMYEVEFHYEASNSAAGVSNFARVMVNGKFVSTVRQIDFQAGGAGTAVGVTDKIPVYLPPGYHYVNLMWWASGGNHYLNYSRTLSVREAS